ncbi:DUF3035 domain-containing protein [Epibacterium sp. DP7N7-1]|jgi:hypothetical protein|uniref:DUF3035 domain-containing protein n=1 Tax=Tritonibacter TaxID=2083206 RepID=UPI0001B8A5CA|nr:MULTISPECIES: DUF3035 domain-containing protein [Tritonibacter]EEW57964.1 putative lipoprotein [Ruegeria sp. TrichCH4B]MBW3242250.1 DUF3035 domain-containing protein [Epibacterium sp. DP7N7-1]MCZ4268709.1 DUF3035 domain-containing protein [Rhodobacteraceae bacterium G21628-S1]MEE2809504.1 DUF3035 domain-containing protein [Pseudomonadota bacterium]NKX37086.1 DUF3035 domain-containing protein [Rhodobacteraceae bacterium R_SAG4]PXW79922.1 beta-barrel assembly complex subunit BamF [Ruegeria s
MRFVTAPIILSSVLLVAACANKPLHDLDARRNTPDEFLVLPNKPLEQPESYAALPQPTPGGSNRTDRNPQAEAIVALGGRPSGAGIPASDGALVTAASRHGVQGDIRETLTAEDTKRRKRAGILANIKLFPVDRYAETYEREALDPQDVSTAYRRAGVPTPSSPPKGE